VHTGTLIEKDEKCMKCYALLAAGTRLNSTWLESPLLWRTDKQPGGQGLWQGVGRGDGPSGGRQYLN